MLIILYLESTEYNLCLYDTGEHITFEGQDVISTLVKMLLGCCHRLLPNLYETNVSHVNNSSTLI